MKKNRGLKAILLERGSNPPIKTKYASYPTYSRNEMRLIRKGSENAEVG
jgi:hypothetical protein